MWLWTHSILFSSSFPFSLSGGNKTIQPILFDDIAFNLIWEIFLLSTFDCSRRTAIRQGEHRIKRCDVIETNILGTRFNDPQTAFWQPKLDTRLCISVFPTLKRCITSSNVTRSIFSVGICSSSLVGWEKCKCFHNSRKAKSAPCQNIVC